jgi:hypothetical protein
MSGTELEKTNSGVVANPEGFFVEGPEMGVDDPLRIGRDGDQVSVTQDKDGALYVRPGSDKPTVEKIVKSVESGASRIILDKSPNLSDLNSGRAWNGVLGEKTPGAELRNQ